MVNIDHGGVDGVPDKGRIGREETSAATAADARRA
jgi:hypothetical protein